VARILLIEDNQGVGELAAYVLQGVGHTVVMVGSGAVALRSLGTGPFDLILCDLHLGDGAMNGLELHAALRTRGVTTPFVLSSGWLKDDGQLQHPLPGDVYFLEKPWSPDDLVGAVRRVLRR
jgi:CheY-like chemotaxis protein